MRLGGYQKLTLIDYPGVIATTVFTVGCSFRCPFCHNPELVIKSRFPAPDGLEDEFFRHLAKRKGKLEGVCITGGEPTIQPDIIDFIRKIKALGFLVKLDSNGTRPDVLKKIIDEKLVDYIAMDIKNRLKNYVQTAGLVETRHASSLRENIKSSVEMIMNSGIPYEFRTTVVPGIHTEEDFVEIAKWLKGAKAYYLQEYRETTILDPKLKKKTKSKSLDLEKIRKLMSGHIGKVGIRENN